MDEESVKFSSNGDAGLHWETQMGSYMKTNQMVKGCPVFEQVDGRGKDEFVNHFSIYHLSNLVNKIIIIF